jgi:hypothetical protein
VRTRAAPTHLYAHRAPRNPITLLIKSKLRRKQIFHVGEKPPVCFWRRFEKVFKFFLKFIAF